MQQEHSPYERDEKVASAQQQQMQKSPMYVETEKLQKKTQAAAHIL